ncbi:hypothetical protein BpHYR1_013484 [Brachionus plicatilis]|uniref:Uncharacterized protein n=1 Tax=Brachionus plicatilis TaxID=10195 RepID=A0A3M7PJR5_BRAPC|nr:hypothetical protein BpHYR1_013484 [Brachionus plicatilis]
MDSKRIKKLKVFISSKAKSILSKRSLKSLLPTPMNHKKLTNKVYNSSSVRELNNPFLHSKYKLNVKVSLKIFEKNKKKYDI